MTVEAYIEQGFEALQKGEWSNAMQAFESLPHGADVPEANLGLARAMWWLGDLHGMIEHYERAYAGFRQRPDPASAAGVALLLGFHACTHRANRRMAEGWIRRAARLIDEHDLDSLRGELALFKGCLEEDGSSIEAMARTALDHGRQRGDPDLELCALSLLGHGLIEQGRVDDGMSLLDEAMAASLGGEPERLDTVVFASCRMIVSCARCAAFERAAAWIRAARRFTERYGCPFLFVECRLVYGSVLFQTGRWREAERELTAAIEMSRDSALAYFADATACLATMRLAQGSIEETERLVADIDGFDAALPVRARLHLMNGRPEAAAGLARRGLAGTTELCLKRVELMEIMGEAELALGESTAASARGRALASKGVERGCRVAVARGERLVGRAAALTEPEASRQHLRAALNEFKHLDMPLEAALTCLALADVLAMQQSPLAEEEARAALQTSEELGAARLADEALALLRSLGVRAARSGPRTDGDITAREEEVLSLLGKGLSNPEIAERLFISRKTVEHHASSVFAKLNLRNRADAAAEAVRREIERTSPN
jgi:DNA-binding CsgD family transcriptional regulator